MKPNLFCTIKDIMDSLTPEGERPTNKRVNLSGFNSDNRLNPDSYLK